MFCSPKLDESYNDLVGLYLNVFFVFFRAKVSKRKKEKSGVAPAV